MPHINFEFFGPGIKNEIISSKRINKIHKQILFFHATCYYVIELVMMSPFVTKKNPK